MLGRRRLALAPRGARGGVDAGSDGAEDRLEPGDHLGLAADHQAEAALQPPDAAAGADVEVVEAAGAEVLGAMDVVAVVAVAAVDDGIPGLQASGEVVDGPPGERRRDHDPRRPRRPQPRDELVERPGADRPLLLEPAHGVGIDVEYDTLVPMTHQPAHQVGAHPAQADHAQLTEAGRRKLVEATEPHLAAVRGLFEERYSEEELVRLAELLARLPGPPVGDASECTP